MNMAPWKKYTIRGFVWVFLTIGISFPAAFHYKHRNDEYKIPSLESQGPKIITEDPNFKALGATQQAEKLFRARNGGTIVLGSTDGAPTTIYHGMYRDNKQSMDLDKTLHDFVGEFNEAHHEDFHWAFLADLAAALGTFLSACMEFSEARSCYNESKDNKRESGEVEIPVAESKSQAEPFADEQNDAHSDNAENDSH